MIQNTPAGTQEYLKDNNIIWWPIPPESPDINPIENVWGCMKCFLKDSYKSTNLENLQAAISTFWKTLTPALCTKYISHLNKVIPTVITVEGAASGY